MTSVVTLAPLAMQLARLVSLDELFPRGTVEGALRDAREQDRESGAAKLPDDIQQFFAHYLVVARAAAELLGAPAFDALLRFHEQVEDEYMPGGPPLSPIYDSFAMQFVLSAVPQGIGNETPYSVIARLLVRDPSRSRLQGMAQSLADSRFDLYRVKGVSGHTAEIEAVRGGGSLSVLLTGPFLRKGDFGLMRVLTFDDRRFIADSPYLLEASEDEWQQHLHRIVDQPQGVVSSSTSQRARKPSSKEQARRHQKDKARAGRNEPEELIKRYLKFGLNPRYWFDYVMDAYAGERRGIVFLAGVPDRPELLPHSRAGTSEPSLPPVAEFRRALLQTAIQEGLIDCAMQELRGLGNHKGHEASALTPNEQTLVAAYATFGLRAAGGTSLLTRLERSRGAESLHPDVRSFIDSLQRGWFTALRVDRIHLDKGLDAFDLLRGQKLHISERSATRQLGLGDLLLGWLCKDSTGTLTLEGGLAHVPSFAAAPLVSLVSTLRRKMPPLTDEHAWKSSAAELPLPLLAGILELRANPPLPQLMNTSGDALELVTGHYRVRDSERVRTVLLREFLADGDGGYRWVDDAGTSLARFELSRYALRVHVNSRKRLQAAQQRLEALLGDAVEQSFAAHEDLAQAARASRGQVRKTGSKSQPLQFSAELSAELNQVVLAKIRSTLDQPIPQFKGKTLRQLARSAKGRPDAISWLREQELILKGNPQLADLDMRPLWQELALPFQGLETDPPL